MSHVLGVSSAPRLALVLSSSLQFLFSYAVWASSLCL